jgi:hypothetical protein
MPRPHRFTRTFRSSLRGLMKAVAILAFLLAMLIPTARMRIDSEKPRIDDIAVTVGLMVAETIVLYYAILAITVARGLFQPPDTGRRVKPILIYGPVLFVVILIVIFEMLDVFLGPH